MKNTRSYFKPSTICGALLAASSLFVNSHAEAVSYVDAGYYGGKHYYEVYYTYLDFTYREEFYSSTCQVTYNNGTVQTNVAVSPGQTCDLTYKVIAYNCSIACQWQESYWILSFSY